MSRLRFVQSVRRIVTWPSRASHHGLYSDIVDSSTAVAIFDRDVLAPVLL